MEDKTSENLEKIKKIQSGDSDALEKLVNDNIGLVKSIAVRYNTQRNELDDLIQIGCIGLIKAARNFDFSYNTAFSTYAVPVIAGEIKRFLRDDSAIKISREIRKRAYEVTKKRTEYINAYSAEPKISELSELCGLTREETSEALCASCEIRSLNEVIGESESMTLESVICDSDDAISSATDRVALKQAIDGLSEIHRAIINLRYSKELSQTETGRILGLSQVKVSREEKKILNYLRKAL